MSVTIIPAYDHPQEIRELFSEYTQMLVDGDPAFGDYLNLQNYDEELLHPEKKYGMPHGRLYLAYCGETLAGCIGLKRIDDENCEMKRLYVRPQFQKSGIGGMLIRRILDDAKDTGYSHMLLDTLPFLETAISMYRRRGFYDIPSYNNSPMEGLVYLKLDL